MSAPTVIMHRPPLKRIDLGAKKPAPKIVEVDECLYTRAMRLTREIRIWNAVTATAQATRQGEQ